MDQLCPATQVLSANLDESARCQRAAAGEHAALTLSSPLSSLAELGQLFLLELRRGAWLDAYLLACGMNQIAEDYLHPDPFALGQIAGYLASLRPPFGRWAGSLAAALGRALAWLRRRSAATQRVAAWQAGLATLVQELADAVAGEPPVVAGSRASLAGEAVVASLPLFPQGLLHEVLRLPPCFTRFDQQPADLARTVAEFAQRWPDRHRRLLVVGLRTSGSYLAPLYASYLKHNDYVDVSVLTLRPGRPFWPQERALLQAVVRCDGLVLLTDDPPATGGSLVRAAAMLEACDVPTAAIVLLLQLFGAPGTFPPALGKYEAVLLPWQKWAIHEQFAAPAVRAALSELLGPATRVTHVERLPLKPNPGGRSHARALYSVRLAGEGGGQQQQRVLVKGAGLGYLGRHVLAAARPLRRYLPQVYGLRAGLLYRAWLPARRALAASPESVTPDEVAGIAAYVAERRMALPAAVDATPGFWGLWPAWEVAANIVSRAYASGWTAARVLGVDRAMLRLTRVAQPCVIDGNMAPALWFRGMPGKPPLKAGWEGRAFAGGPKQMACHDAAFDIASLAAGLDVAAPLSPAAAAAALHLRATYEALTGEAIGAERWLLYQLAYLWRERRLGAVMPSAARQALARAMQRYWAEVLFHDVAAPAGGELVAIDIDGVLETTAMGFPSLSPAGALALRALARHGYRPILATGRSLGEVRERCHSYPLAGGVAEYGAVTYDHATGRVRSLLSAGQGADLDALRRALGELGVALEDGHEYSVRAYRVDA
ncbi:MAG TPA: hypothetical protein PLB78_06305, partial [Anaerolineae bacterium]|nr:hypothetical protein [Anaerolineae bacterium]